MSSQAPEISDPVDLHFVAFVVVDGTVFHFSVVYLFIVFRYFFFIF